MRSTCAGSQMVPVAHWEEKRVDVSLTCAGSQSCRCGWQGGLGGNAKEGHQHPRGRCPCDDSLQSLQGLGFLRVLEASYIASWQSRKSTGGPQQRGIDTGAGVLCGWC